MSDKSMLEKWAEEFGSLYYYTENGELKSDGPNPLRVDAFKAGFMKAIAELEAEKANVSADALMVWGGAIQFLKDKTEGR